MYNDPLSITLLGLAAFCAIIAGAAIWIAIRCADAYDNHARDEADAMTRKRHKLEAAAEIRGEIVELWETSEIPGGLETAHELAAVALARIDAYPYKISGDDDAKN